MGFGPIMVPGPRLPAAPSSMQTLLFFSPHVLSCSPGGGGGDGAGGGRVRGVEGLEGGLVASPEKPSTVAALLLLHHHHHHHHGDDCQHGPRSAVAPPSKCELAESCRGTAGARSSLPRVHTYIHRRAAVPLNSGVAPSLRSCAGWKGNQSRNANTRGGGVRGEGEGTTDDRPALVRIDT